MDAHSAKMTHLAASLSWERLLYSTRQGWFGHQPWFGCAGKHNLESSVTSSCSIAELGKMAVIFMNSILPACQLSKLA